MADRGWRPCVALLPLHWPRKKPRRFYPRGTVYFQLKVGRATCDLARYPYQGTYLVRVWEHCPLTPRPSLVWDGDEDIPVKRPNPKAVPEGPQSTASLDTKLFTKLSPILEHCAVTRYDDGTSRQTGWITLRVLGTQWQVQVKDPATGLSFSTLAPSVDNALVLSASLLASPDCPWEEDPWLKGQKKKK